MVIQGINAHKVVTINNSIVENFKEIGAICVHPGIRDYNYCKYKGGILYFKRIDQILLKLDISFSE